MNIKQLLGPLVVPLINLFRPTLVARICSHETKKEGIVYVGKKALSLSLAVDENGYTPYCLDCLGRMSIRCAVCGDLIQVGEPVAVYDRNSFVSLPSHAVSYKYDERYVIGCLKDKVRAVDQKFCTVFSPELSPYTQELMQAYRLRRSCAQGC